jgi:type IV pilus assembly protein PilX
VLLVALIFLLLLTMLALSAAARSLLQERMVGGLRNAQLAEMGAEAAVRGAEWKLWSLSARGLRLDCPSDLLGSCYSFDPATPNNAAKRFRTSTSWPADTDLSASTEYKGDGTSAIDYTTSRGSTLTGDSQKIAQLAKNPRYIIERLGQETPPGVGSQIEGGVTAAYGSSSTPSTSLWLWRVTARSTGGNADTMRIVESTYAAPGNN